MKLYTHFRSSAAFRVRIALNLKGLAYEPVFVSFAKGEHRQPAYAAINPQGLMPALILDDGTRLNQSLAIIEYLAETRDGTGLLPAHPIDRQRVRALSYAVAMDIHPVCNLGVVAHVMAGAGDGGAARREWMQKFIGEGLAAFERMLDRPATGEFCHGDRPTMADLCLVPQVYNARRWDVDLSACPRIVAIDRRCAAIDAFRRAHPDRAKP